MSSLTSINSAVVTILSLQAPAYSATFAVFMVSEKKATTVVHHRFWTERNEDPTSRHKILC